MKSKAFTYLLIGLVITVWGLIVYRVVDASIEPDEKVAASRTSAPLIQSLDDYKFKDTFKLVLNYPDPFLKELASSKEVRVAEPVDVPVLSKPAVSVKPIVKWDMVQYNGYINRGNKKLSLLSISQTDYVLAEGQTVQAFKLLKNLRDSILLSSQGQTKFIRLK